MTIVISQQLDALDPSLLNQRAKHQPVESFYLPQMTFTELAEISNELPNKTRQSPDLVQDLNTMISVIQIEINPYLSVPTCPKLLKHLNAICLKIQKKMEHHDASKSIDQKLRNEKFDYFFKPIQGEITFHNESIQPSQFIVDAIMLLSLSASNQHVTSQESEAVLKPTEIIINGETQSIANAFNHDEKQYESALPFEDDLDQKILIKDPQTIKNGGVIVNADTFKEMAVSYNRHPIITDKSLNDCTLSYLIPLSNRSYIGINFNPNIFRNLDDLFSECQQFNLESEQLQKELLFLNSTNQPSVNINNNLQANDSLFDENQDSEEDPLEV